MIKIFIFSTLCITIFAGIIEHHDYNDHLAYAHADGGGGGGGDEHDTDIHHEIEHKHAQSHQSFKIHHFHPVPVYIKKEDQEFLKHPVEIGGSKSKLKVLHPETEKSHNYGAILEQHSESKFHHIGGHYGDGGGDEYHHYEHYDHHHHE